MLLLSRRDKTSVKNVHPMFIYSVGIIHKGSLAHWWLADMVFTYFTNGLRTTFNHLRGWDQNPHLISIQIQPLRGCKVIRGLSVFP
jgi:hypothetical protein